MIAVPYTFTEELSFEPDNNRTLPYNIEAEIYVLGMIMDNPNAMSRIADRLRPEHFYVGAYKDIYQACLKLYKKRQPIDILHVASWLSDHNLLGKIGGRSTLANIATTTLDNTLNIMVSGATIDSLTAKITTAAARRNSIKTLNKVISLAYDTQTEWTDVCITLENEVEKIISAPIAPTKEENQLWHYNQLIKELENIYLKTPNPGLKLYKLQELANASPGRRVKDLEDLYMKYLCATVEPRKSLDELEEEVGTQGRKWLLGGMLPQATTALVIADGGIGKTKFLYDLLYCIAEGKNWNGFPATADRRRVLIYQGDESKHDMLQALNKRGFKPGTEVRQNTEVRFGWNTDAMSILYQDADEFKPDVIMIDSLTFAQRYSIYDENKTEYSRAVLELNKFAAETGITVVIIHHTNRNGGSRGTTAVRNAASEVIKLEKDPNPSANPQEKILTIEKSRSRRFPASYRLFFNEEDFSFSLLEEVGQELGSPDNSTKDRIIKFLQENANKKFEAEEVAHYIGTTSGNARRCLSQLARDGLVSLDERSFSGTKKLYYISRESENCSTESSLPSVTITPSTRITSESDSNAYQSDSNSETENVYKNNGSPVITSMITLDDHLTNHNTNHCPESISAKNSSENSEGDHLSTSENAVLANPELEKKVSINDDHLITFGGNVETASNPAGDPVRRSQGDHEVIQGDRDRLDDNSNVLQTLPPSPLKRADFEEKGIYWLARLNIQVMVWKLFKSLPFAEVYQAENPIDKIRVNLSELYPLPEFKVGEEVAVLGEHKKFIDRVFTISAVHPGGIWIHGKTRVGTESYGPFEPSQLRKLSG
ncbi:AAA family ATPase [Nostoc sp. CHAB 5836]|uniref:DnaB-like helicase N-terminal domain-containing protein n=1 Tax=Nostoc sp. CHAB 5836 TaxID=2780404 RepID=UPI001E441637|nr:DnaB-like helicase N-terminal domain-containing protein [Nostoc sp. CHAB 5836]MCC5619489.1 AAA family ATPase [Nostoc sp. CHAB 5836]